MKTYKITVPFPPSVNHCYYHPKNKHFITAKGRLYLQLVVPETLHQKFCKQLSQRLGVRDRGVYPPDRRKRDLDNLMKAPIDALCHGGLIIDDAQINVLHIERKEIVKGGKLIINIWEIVQQE